MRSFILIFLVLICIFDTNILFGQCTFTGPEIIAPNTSRTFNLEISGAVNNNLADTDQGVCAVLLDFQHPLIGDLTIKLRSPSNEEVTLIGPIGITNFTNNSRWNISFYPCGFIVDPDPGFTSKWSNLQNWGQFGYFEGAYYPADKCLEDFNFGPVNGIWQIEFINQYPFDVPVNSAILHDFSLLFCDPTGLDCNICLAKGGNLIGPNGEFCQGDQQLLLEVEKQIAGIQPDPSEFGYTYLIGQAGTLKFVQGTPDLRDFSPGQYTVCGLSYVLEDSLLLPDPVTFNDISIAQLRRDLRSNNPPFCGSVSGECLDIEILNIPEPDSLFLLLCPGDTIFYETDTLLLPGEYSYVYSSSNGCDSIVYVFINTPEVDITLSPLTPLSCGESLEVWIANFSSSITANNLTINWILPNSDIVTEDTLQTSLPGKYTLLLGLTFGNSICNYSFEFTVDATYAPSIFELSYEQSVCQGSHASINILNPESPPIEWTISDPNLQYKISDDLKNVIVEFLEPGVFDVCMSAFDSCTQSFVDSCVSITVLELVYPEIAFDSVYCSLIGEFYLSGFENDILIEQLAGPGIFTLFTETLDYIDFEVSLPGNYWFRLSSPFENCNLYFEQWVTFLAEPIPFSIDYSLAICEPNPLIINLEFNSDEIVIVTLSLGGVLQDIELPGSDIRSIIIPYNEVVFPVALMGYRFLNYPDCQLPDDYPLDLDFVEYPEILVPDTIQVCNSPDGDHPTTVNFADFFNNYFSDVTITNINGIGLGSYDNFSFDNVLPGSYKFDYLLDYYFACNPIGGTIIIEVLPCACPDLINTFSLFLCDDAITDLTIYENVSPGNWELVQGPLNNTVQVINNSIQWLNQPEGSYLITYSIENPIGNCPSKDTLSVVLNNKFNAGTLSKDTVFICTELDTFFNLNDYLMGSDPGIWISNPQNQLSNLEWDSASGVLKTQTLDQGIYSFIYRSSPVNPCPGDSLILVVKLENKKFENLVADVTFGCNNPYAEFNISLDTNLYTVIWEVLEGDFFIQDPSSPNILINEEGKFVLQVLEKRNSCLTKEIFTVTKITDIITDFDLDIDSPICPNDLLGSISVSKVYGGIAPFDYGINQLFSKENDFFDLSPGSYIIDVVDSRGCKFSKTGIVSSPGVLDIDIVGGSIFAPGELASFIANINKDRYLIKSIQWFLDDVLICDSCYDVQFNINKTGTLKLVVLTEEGCVVITEKIIFLDTNIQIFIPDIFTPNRDGINDIFTFYTAETSLWVNQFSVFDKWGNEVYQVKNIDPLNSKIGWDGTYKNKDLGPGVYIYMLLIQRPNEELKTLKGEVLLAR
jgi:gliding motility-associated-like protein